MKAVYIIEARRSAMTKANKGSFASTRPDDLLADIIKQTVILSKIDPKDIGDVVIGCAFPEAEQGFNVARVSTLLAGLPNSVPGITVNRYCSSGLNAIAIAARQIACGEVEVALAGGVESMSLIPMGGNKPSFSPRLFADEENIAIAYGMGITAENVAKQWNISRTDQDEFALESHQKAAEAIKYGYFKDEVIPVEVEQTKVDLASPKAKTVSRIIDQDEGVRSDTNLESLAKLKPAFMVNGSVTAGNSSQMTDGAACLVLVSEEYLKKHKLTPIAKFIGFAVAGVPADIMGIGPIKAIPQVLKQTGMTLEQIDWIELNEAFAAQSLAVINELKLDRQKINPYGGAIALGHPLGATGAILATKLIHGLRRTGKKYGLTTMCIGSGMGAAGIFEAIPKVNS